MAEAQSAAACAAGERVLCGGGGARVAVSVMRDVSVSAGDRANYTVNTEKSRPLYNIYIILYYAVCVCVMQTCF